jgi:lipoate-protein ligase A
VTYAVAAPVSMFGSLAESYLAIHRLIATALARLGVSATLARTPETGHRSPSFGACFASPAGGEIVANGRKLVGSAQVREGDGFLQHGSSLLDDGQDMVTRVTRGSPVPVSATSLSAVLGRNVGFAEVADAISAEAQEAWCVDTTGVPEYGPDPLLVSQFNDPAWTWRR